MKEIACTDCVVSVLLNIDTKRAADLSKNQQNAISNLSSAGLVPPLRFAK
jgi:hypothetical protein